MGSASGRARQSRILTALLGVMALIVGSCAHHADFRPVDAATKLAPGYVAAYYEVEKRQRNIGDVKIWSPGAYPAQINGEQTAIHVRMRVRNDTQEPLELALNETYVEITTDERRFVTVRDEARVEGAATVEAISTTRLDLYYVLPGDLDADDVAAFELNWMLRTAEGVVTQTTPFVRDEEEPNVYWRPSFYFGYNYGYPYGPWPGPYWWP